MAQLLREIHTAEPTHAMHEQLVQMAEQRLARVDEKIAAYQQDRLAAVDAVERAKSDQAVFLHANPMPAERTQQAIFP